MKKILAATAFALIFAGANPAMAFGGDDGRHGEFKKMSKEERDAKKAEWQGLSKEEKVKLIEEKRERKLKRMDEKWSKMSDDEKIRFVEERHEKRKGKGPKHSDGE